MATVNDLTNLFPAVEEKLARLDNDFPAQVEDFRQQLKIFGLSAKAGGGASFLFNRRPAKAVNRLC